MQGKIGNSVAVIVAAAHERGIPLLRIRVRCGSFWEVFAEDRLPDISQIATFDHWYTRFFKISRGAVARWIEADEARP